ncbi:MAG: FkbM family methyltransferase, partial [Bdellovibrionales bacterium]|nr:FkbM family methyltransferase [Bdellovibrionales bacterium]
MIQRLRSKLSSMWLRLRSIWLLADRVTLEEAEALLALHQDLKVKVIDFQRAARVLAQLDSAEDLEYLQIAHKNFSQALRRRHVPPVHASVALENIEVFFNLGLLDAPPEKNIYRNWGTFAQEGEDLILSRLLGNSGFYVDVGAHHPFRFSNTALLYDLGWSGITIEPNPEGHATLKKFRPRDTSLNIAILNQTTDQKQDQTFYMFEEPALNSFDKKYAEEMLKQGFALRQQVQLPSRTLAEIFAEHA